MRFLTGVSNHRVQEINNMVFQYYPDTDMLYIKLADGVSTESEEVATGVVLDFDERNRVVGIEIEDASKLIDLSRLEVLALPIENLVFSEKAPAGIHSAG
jgi:uncharacterized protein YuzE